jgi:hypothetical protein
LEAVELLGDAVRRMDTIAADHAEDMRALVAQGEPLNPSQQALTRNQGMSSGWRWSSRCCCRAGYTVRKPCTSGYMVAT